MSGTGDVNNDGIDDLIIGATRCRTDPSFLGGIQVSLCDIWSKG